MFNLYCQYRFRCFVLRSSIMSAKIQLIFGNSAKKTMISFVWRVTLCNFGFAELTMHSEMKRKTSFPFAFLSFFRNFARILSFSLYKGGLGD